MTNKNRSKIFISIFSVLLIFALTLVLSPQNMAFASGESSDPVDDSSAQPEGNLNLSLENSGYTSYLPLIFIPGSCSSTGIDSQFNGDFLCWLEHSGDWDVDSENLYTEGIAGNSSSISYDGGDFADFDYQVRMMRLGNEINANRIIIRGTPDPLDADNHWYNYYYFQYNRIGGFSVYKGVSGGTSIALQSWTLSSAINPGDNWNTLRVVADGGDLSFYINGTLVWSGTDTDLTSGRVGIGMFRSSSSSGDQLLVDWATLTTLTP